MTIAENKRVLRRWLEEFWNQGNEATAAELLSDEIVDAPSGSQRIAAGADALRNFVRSWRSAFPDGRMTIEDMISEGDLVAARLTWRGTHLGDFMGLAPTGKRVAVTIMAFERIVNGKIVQGWGEANMLGLVQQLGAVGSVGRLTVPDLVDVPSESSSGLSDAEIRAFVDTWCRRLDAHAPPDELLGLVDVDEFEAQFPGGQRQTRAEFAEFYQQSLGKFFDERHEVRRLDFHPDPLGAEVRLLVRWQARQRTDNPSTDELLSRDVKQRWRIRRSPRTNRPVLLRYVIESTEPVHPSSSS
jgi:steroid delta-isomerase-like uncharacterized protein